jgi:hypothetical protein
MFEGFKLLERRLHMKLGHQVLEAVSRAFDPVQGSPPLWVLFGRFRLKESRRALAPGATLLEDIDRGLD